ncbi:MAG: MFS transporter [Spirochaetales bacterium]|nr:MFS transporter [Spirochaetales bacterium]
MENSRTTSFHFGWIILVMVVVIVTGALGFARFGYTMIINHMKEGLKLDESMAGDLATANMVGYLVLSLTCGFLASKFGPRIVIFLFMLLVSLSMFLTGIAENYLTALAGRFLTGMGSGGTNIPAMGLISAWFAARRRGLATGIGVGGSSVGLLVTGLTLPVIFTMYGTDGWRYAWFFLSFLTLVIAVLSLVLIRNSPADKGLSPIGQLPGNAGDAAGTRKSPGWASIVTTPSVWHLAVIYIMFGFAYIIYSLFYVRYLVKEASIPLEWAGGMWAAIGGVSIVSGFIWGGVSDRIGRKFALAIVYALQAACFLVFGLWRAMPGFIISSVLFAVTAWSIPAIMAASCGDILGPKLAPAALGFITLFFGIGQALGPAAAGRIAENTGSYALAFIIAGGASFIGAIGAVFLKGKREA